VYHDSDVMEVVSNISAILKKEFGISIDILEHSDTQEYIEYEIKKIK